MLGLRTGLLQWGPANRTVVIWEQLPDSHTLLGEGNANTVYWYMWLDTTGGPLVLEIPPQVLGLINDIWSRWVVDLGITGPDQGQGASTWCSPRLHRRGPPARAPPLRIYPLAQAANPPQTSFVNVSGKDFTIIGPADATALEHAGSLRQHWYQEGPALCPRCAHERDAGGGDQGRLRHRPRHLLPVPRSGRLLLPQQRLAATASSRTGRG